MPLKDSDNLNLPDAPDFISKPPSYTASEMAQQCEKLLPHWNRIRALNPPPPFSGEPFRLFPEDLGESSAADARERAGGESASEGGKPQASSEEGRR